MAYEDNQQEPALPINDNDGVESIKFLPKYFRTEFNKKFLNATLDQYIKPGVVEKINSYYGRKISKAYNPQDNYIGATTKQRADYQLEPVSLIKDSLDNVTFYADYNDLINRLKTLDGNYENHSELNSQEFYSWNPHIDLDKLINYREYYWLPNGPETVTVVGQTKEIQSTYTISLKDNDDNLSYVFSPDGLTNNPTITLYRGQTYRFEIDTPSHPIAFATKKSFTPGQAILIEKFDGLLSSGIYDINLYDLDGTVYDAGGYLIPPNEASFTEGEQVNTSLIYETGITYYDDEGNEISVVFIEKGILEFTVPEVAPDRLYYVSKYDANLSGLIKIKDIIENTEINVEKEIIGKKYYTTSAGWNFSNGFKVKFAGDVTPIEYANGEYYVEGVGDKIQLINQENLAVSGSFVDDVVVPFDDISFDEYPFSEALGFPSTKDYILINRGSQDGNLWSRYNRWFHKDVIEQSIKLTKQEKTIDQTSRASRPIIEFEKGLKLFNFGTANKKNIDLIDNFTKDIFSNIEGTTGYNIDGIDLSEGMRVLFAADTDVNVKGKIYTINFVTINNVKQITLREPADSSPLEDETVLVRFGNTYRGKFFYFTNNTWKECQEKVKVNQAPLFAMFDETDQPLEDLNYYPSSQFTGNKIFSYLESTGTVDNELGIALSYQSIENVGDITFRFDLVNDSFYYTNSANQVLQYFTKFGLLRKYLDRTTYEYLNGYEKHVGDSKQFVMRQYVANGISSQFEVDVYSNARFINDVKVKVFLNNKFLQENVDYMLEIVNNEKLFVNLNSVPTKDSVIVLKTHSSVVKNNRQGFYEIPYNLERNPNNDLLENFTLGEINEHISSIIENLPNFRGDFPGISNLRDLGKVVQFGTKFITHTAPTNFYLYHILDDDNNVFKAIDYARQEYGKFKRNFLETAESLGFEGNDRIHLDKILAAIAIDKGKETVWTISDTLPFLNSIVSTFVIEDPDQTYFALRQPYDLNTDSLRAVNVYINYKQLLYGIDYTFNDEGFLVLTATKEVDDIVEVVEYDTTIGNFVPPTPTKLGLYPSFIPEFLLDYKENTAEKVGPYKVYGTIANQPTQNQKLGWFYPVFTSKEKADAYNLENNGISSSLLLELKGNSLPLFVPNNFVNAGQDTIEYEEFTLGNAYIQGHDGSKTIVFKDYRDNLIIELERRIYNNLKINYDEELFNIHDFIPGLFRTTGITKAQLNKSLLPSFLEWVRLVGLDYTENTYLDINNTFTFNYNFSNYLNNTRIEIGYWRELYKFVFDTDKPHIAPWEMLGIYKKPSWWDQQYGPGPYTKNNTILWSDLEQGIVRNPKFVVKTKYIRPGLQNMIPVDEFGNLLSPNDSKVALNIQGINVRNSFKFGDGGPIESSWKNTSDYIFALMKAFILCKPAKFFGTGFDRSKQKKNLLGQIIYSQNTIGNFVQLGSVELPTKENLSKGILNYIIAYIEQTYKSITQYQYNIQNLKNQLSFKVGGYTEKEKFKLLLDSRTPLNQGNVFIPEENYNVILNKSFPIDEIKYSGVIVEKRVAGYLIKGYDLTSPYFTYYQSYSLSNDPSVNVGGVSESYAIWDSNTQYAQGSIISYQNVYYRVLETHVTNTTFNLELYQKLPSLPAKGGINAFFRNKFREYPTTVEYGVTFSNYQEVVDFLLGYGKYLEELGFVYNYFDTNEYNVYDWSNMAKKFLFWVTQNWDYNSFITLSPSAKQLQFNAKDKTVDNIFNTFGGISIFGANGKILSATDLRINKSTDNIFTIESTLDSNGIYALRIPLITYEHAIIIDNKTVFNDIIYDPAPGYRQERIKVLGYKTANWAGSLVIPGFLYDDATINDWTQYKDYNLGDIVKYKEYYYAANNKIVGTDVFVFTDWKKLDNKPAAGLYPNFDYQINQFADFYDLDSDNFDSNKQKLAQHLIGYQKRKYLENIINDDVSQYKFYQGMILEKGSKNSLNKLFDSLASSNKDSLEFYEEWGIQDGQYGLSSGFDEIEVILDETKFKLTPQPILLTDKIAGNETDFIYRIKSGDIYVKPADYNNNPFPVKKFTTGYVKNAGYVNPADVDNLFGTYDGLLDLDITDIKEDSFIWIGNFNKDWSVFQYTQVENELTGYTVDDKNVTVILTFQKTVVGISKDDIIGIYKIQKELFDVEDSSRLVAIEESQLNGFFKVVDVYLTRVIVKISESLLGVIASEKFENSFGIVTEFKQVRVESPNEINNVSNEFVSLGQKFWIDNIQDDNWGVVVKENNYDVGSVISNLEPGVQYFEFLATVDFTYTFAWSADKLVLGSIFIDDTATSGIQTLSPITTQSGEYIIGGIFSKIYVRLASASKILRFSIKRSDFVGTIPDYDYVAKGGRDKKTAINVNFNKMYIVDNELNFGYSLSADFRNTFLAVGAPNDGDGKVYIYSRGSETGQFQLLDTIEPPDGYADTGQKFGSSVSFSEDSKYLIVGAPNATNVRTLYKGDYSIYQDYAIGNVASYNGAYWEASVEIKGTAEGSLFDSFTNYNDLLYSLNLDEYGSEEIPFLIAGNYPFTQITTDHFLVRVTFDVYQGIAPGDGIYLHWNTLTNANQTQIQLVDRQPFNGTIPYLNKTYLDQVHVVYEKVQLILYVSTTTNIPQVGDVVTTGSGSATVVYSLFVDGATTIYVNLVSGQFVDDDSLFIDGIDFVGEFVLLATNDDTNTTGILGGLVMIQTATDYFVGDTNEDTGRGLVVRDVINTPTGNNSFYYNILDYKTSVTDSNNTDHSLIGQLSQQGFPGPGGSTAAILSNFYYVRAPKSLTDTLNSGDLVSVYFNNLKDTVTTLVTNNLITVLTGEVLTQQNTGATLIVFEGVINSNQIKVTNVIGTFNTNDILIGSQSGNLGARPNSTLILDNLVEPTDIEIPYSLINRSAPVYDLWDGYIEYINTFFLGGNPFEPLPRYRYNPTLGTIADYNQGQIVEDVTTGAQAEVMYYQRNLNNVRIYVKNITGNWSKGDLFGNNAEIKMLEVDNPPQYDAYGRADIYTVQRILGQVQAISLGYAPADIGKLIVFESGGNLAVPSNPYLKGEEYWIFSNEDVQGIPTSTLPPSATNLDWQEIFKLEANSTGAASGFYNEGLTYIYRRFGTNVEFIHALLDPNRTNQGKFGSNVKVTYQNDLYRLFSSTKRYNKLWTQPAGDFQNVIPIATGIQIYRTYDNGLLVDVNLIWNKDSVTIFSITGIDNIDNTFFTSIGIDGNTSSLETYIKTVGIKLTESDEIIQYYAGDFKGEFSYSSVGDQSFTDSWFEILKEAYGKIIFVKYGVENNLQYSWDYAKNKLFKGSFVAENEYRYGDIVYLVTNGLGTLYQAITNVESGQFNINQWTKLDSLIDYTGQIPNDTVFKVLDDINADSAIPDIDILTGFGKRFDVSDNGEVLITTAEYLNEPNVVSIYRNNNGFYQWSQNIVAPDEEIEFGKSISINEDGSIIVIGAPLDDRKRINQGIVFVYHQLNGKFELLTELYSPQNEYGELYGTTVCVSGNSLIVGAVNAEAYEYVDIDNGNTIFDNGFTRFKTLYQEGVDADNQFFKFEVTNTGVVYTYEKIGNFYVFADTLRYETSFSPVIEFSKYVICKNNHVYTGLPLVASNPNYFGTVISYRKSSDIYKRIRQQKSTVDLQKIKKMFLYNKKTNRKLVDLDYIDPLQGKIPGPAEENLKFKTYYDPANYNVTDGRTNVVLNPNEVWTTKNVGQLWWDLTNAKFYYPYQEDITYSTNFWSAIFLTNTIDVYEWVSSELSPTQWDALAGTEEGITLGISGKSRYGNAVYSYSRVYDSIKQNFKNKYFFWVKDKRIVPNIDSRTLSAYDVSKLIANPKNEGYKFVALVTSDSFTVYNCDNLLNDKDVVLNIQWYKDVNQNLNLHTQYQIITDGLETSIPNLNIESKWIDSLVGYDIAGRAVPDIKVSEKYRYGILNSPRQSFFKNREEALKQFFVRINRICKENLIADLKNLYRLASQENYPSTVTRLYDTAVDTALELNLLGVAKASQAVLDIVVRDGVVINIIVANPGRGYLVPPTFTIYGGGQDLELEIQLNAVGTINAVNIINGGSGFTSNSYIEVRKFTVLVITDETIQGKWALYERNSNASRWDRIRSQAYNTNLYWDYIDWYATGYSSNTFVNYTVDYVYEIETKDPVIGEIVKVNFVGAGNWVLYKKVSNDKDFLLDNYTIVAKQNGTIQFGSGLYSTTNELSSFDGETYDAKFYDSIPSTETRIIISTIKNDIFIDELLVEWNKLFFASLRYILTEQSRVDWLFKTSFVKAKHNAGELREDITFNNDNLSSYEDYFNEVKPFKAKIREYVSSYEKLEAIPGLVGDFDLSPKINKVTNRIDTYKVTVFNNNIIGAGNILTYPDRMWIDTIGFELMSVTIADPGKGYESAPKLSVVGGGGSGAEVEARLGIEGKIAAIVVINPGKGYISPPTIVISGTLGESGTDARLLAVIGNGLPRSIKTAIKFDRYTRYNSSLNRNRTETFIGSGSKYIFDLKWPINLDTTTLSIKINNVELLRSEYEYENIEEKTEEYVRKIGRIILVEAAEINSTVIISYQIDLALFNAVDRINYGYTASATGFGRELNQLMDGIDYGGVEVKSFDFGAASGWDIDPYATGYYDIYDTTFDDVIINTDGSTTVIELDKPLETDIVYNLYKNGVRLDDPNFESNPELVKNPNAVIESIIGDGETKELFLQDWGIFVDDDDQIILRKATSDGSFVPSNVQLDTELIGGNLNYSNAKGIAADDINVDGDGFFTLANSKGPEELLPGLVLDTLDIKVFERSVGGLGKISSRNYFGDGILDTFAIGEDFRSVNEIFVKVNNLSNYINLDYKIQDGNVIFNTPPINKSFISIIGFDLSGQNILDYDTIIGNGIDTEFNLNIIWSENINSMAVVDYVDVDHVITQGDNNQVVLKLGSAIPNGKILKYALFIGQNKLYSSVFVDEFIKGDENTFQLTQTPFFLEPLEWFTIVSVNDEVLTSGYSEKFYVTAQREYRLKLYQVPVTSLKREHIRVFLNNKELTFLQQWNLLSTGLFVEEGSEYDQIGSLITLVDGVGNVGDQLDVYIVGLKSDTVSGGEYRFGYFDNNEFIKTPDTLYIDRVLNPNDVVRVIQFSNHDLLNMRKSTFDVVERTPLSQGNIPSEIVIIVDGITTVFELTAELELGEKYKVILNNIRIDDPVFNTILPTTNPNAKVKTIEGSGQTQININDFNIELEIGDVIKISNVNAVIEFDGNTADWYEYRMLKLGLVPLASKAIDDQYTWVVKNNTLLTPSIDYKLNDARDKVKIISGLQENDRVEVIHFGNNNFQDKFGFRQFKDILNRTQYHVLANSNTLKLTQELNWFDKDIYISDQNLLPTPAVQNIVPGVMFIDNERIEYFIKQDNKITQVRRGTLGTGIKDTYPVGTKITNQSKDTVIPYKDEIVTSTYIGDGTSNQFILDFVANSVNEFEVFVAGRRLRKTTLQSYQLETENRDKYASIGEEVSQDSNEGDITLPAEFVLDNNTLVLLDTPLEQQKIFVVRRLGKIWNDEGKTLAESENGLAKFIRAFTVELPR